MRYAISPPENCRFPPPVAKVRLTSLLVLIFGVMTCVCIVGLRFDCFGQSGICGPIYLWEDTLEAGASPPCRECPLEPRRNRGKSCASSSASARHARRGSSGCSLGCDGRLGDQPTSRYRLVGEPTGWQWQIGR